jgi:hypothetical protein
LLAEEAGMVEDWLELIQFEAKEAASAARQAQTRMK